MSVIAALIAEVFLLGGPFAWWLARSAWAGRHPQTAIRVWHATAAGVLVSLATVLILVAHDVWEHAMVWLFHADKPLIHAAYGGTWMARGIGEAALLLLLGGASAMAVVAIRRFLSQRRARDRFRLAVDTSGSETDDPRVRVMDHENPAAFCIPGGRGRDRIVITTAARTLLSAEQMAATLEHERAHLHLRHHRTILAAEVVTTGFGPFGLLRPYADQVRRLAELAADDRASHAHGRLTVAAALLEMGSANPVPSGLDGMPALTGPDVGGRIRRLIAAPARRTSAPAGLLAPAALLVALIAPPAVALAPAVLLMDTAHAQQALGADHAPATGSRAR
ncbi:M56 family metallopeptidase [Streptomyces californicus]|uniref:M56 family metallopeptidase n=1 Tax=Streptomyces californicus TaxID=67351 RepID=UPI0036FFA61B